MNITDFVNAPHTCCICREPIQDWPVGANNAYPVTAEGACCDSCNRQIVIPAREGVRG